MRRIPLVLLLALPACGIVKSRYIKYEDETAAAGPGTGKSCAAALAAFTAQIQPATDSDGACQLCHGTGGQAAAVITFVKGDAETSAANLKKTRFGPDAAKIWGYISGTTHSGRTYAVEFLSEAKLKTWLDAEAQCQ